MAGNAFLLLRNIHGLSGKDLASKIGLSQSYISEIESGKKDPSMKTLDKYLKYFNVSMSCFFVLDECLKSGTVTINVGLTTNNEIPEYKVVFDYSWFLS